MKYILILFLLASCATKSDIEKANIRMDSLNARLVAVENENLFLRVELNEMHELDTAQIQAIYALDSVQQKQLRKGKALRAIGEFFGGVGAGFVKKITPLP